MQEKHPTSGGSWSRNPETGELTQMEEATRWEAPTAEAEAVPVDTATNSLPVTVSEPLALAAPAPETPTAEQSEGSEAVAPDAPVTTGRKVK